LGLDDLRLGWALLSQRRRRGVLGLRHRDEAQHWVHELDVALALTQSADADAILEQHVDRAPLLPDRVREIPRSPLQHLTHGSALVLDQGLDAGREILRSRLALLRMDQNERLIAAI